MTKSTPEPTPTKRPKPHWVGALVIIVVFTALMKGEGPERYLIVGGLITLIGVLLMHIERLEAKEGDRDGNE